MKLATVNPSLDLHIDDLFEKEVIEEFHFSPYLNFTQIN
jgi:hypothetical protein